MNKLPGSLLFSLALFAAGSVHALTYEEASAAFKAKDYVTALNGFKSLAEKGDVKAPPQPRAPRGRPLRSRRLGNKG